MSSLEFDRRRLLRWAGLAGVAAVLPAGCHRPAPALDEQPPDAPMRFPGKVAMRVINDRPPCLETPWEYFRHELTPVEAFYVRWHLQVIPTAIDTRTWRLKVGGAVNKPLELSLDDIKRMPPTSIVAVNQCSGNSRGLVAPRVPGAQWSNGAMGNAKWTGVRLRDVLDKAGVGAKALEVSFNGLDNGGAAGVPDFVKSLEIDKARDANVLLAYAMNDQPLPLLNGFPLRVVVPGWYATYWVKALQQINVLTAPFTGYWMNPAYRIPTTKNANERPDALAEVLVPINRLNVRSFFTSPARGGKVPLDAPLALEGMAFDGGDGIRSVEVSEDGTTWKAATLGTDLGGFSFRRWKLDWTPTTRGPVTFQVQATSKSKSGETQPTAAGWNRSGFMRNVIEQWTLDVV
jgi:sulfite dehydrogenase (cytochrome) subunit A